MWLIAGHVAYNLNQSSRIFVDTSKHSVDSTRIFIQSRAGGAQESDSRQVIQFETTDDRDMALQLIHGALEAGLPALNLDRQMQEVDEAKTHEDITPLLQEAWKVISNAYEGEWDQAPAMWRARAEVFREHYFNIGGDHA